MADDTESESEGTMIPVHFDWYPLQEHVASLIRTTLARHETVGCALSLADGEALITRLSNDIVRETKSLLGVQPP